MLKKYYLGGFFWAPIPLKRYQNTSGFAADISKLPILEFDYDYIKNKYANKSRLLFKNINRLWYEIKIKNIKLQIFHLTRRQTLTNCVHMYVTYSKS